MEIYKVQNNTTIQQASNSSEVKQSGNKTGINNLVTTSVNSYSGKLDVKSTSSGLNVEALNISNLTLSDSQKQALHQIAQDISNTGYSPGVASRWGQWVTDISVKGGMIDVNALVQEVLRTSYLETTEDLRFYAEKVKYFNDCKKALRDNLTDLRKLQAEATKYATETLGVSDMNDMTPSQQAQMAAWMLSHGNKASKDFYSQLVETTFTSGQAAVLEKIELWATTSGINIPDAVKLQIKQLVESGKSPDAIRLCSQFIVYAGLRSSGSRVKDANISDNDDFDAFLAEDIESLTRDDALAIISIFAPNAANEKADMIESCTSIEEVVALISPEVQQILNTVAGEADLDVLNSVLSDIGTNGAKSSYAIQVCGSVDEAYKTMFGGDDDSATIRQNMGISNLIPPPGMSSFAQLEAEIKAKEEKLNTVGDDAQLANVDLQNMLQKQQQTLQMMSNISKVLYDTAMAITRKIGG
ncbi:MAG: hypothetical protein JW841_03640 [Deltaproteobacteria bacterium]|nr:hypothetical protein [Deltaproteobacteria bacterium]